MVLDFKFSNFSNVKTGCHRVVKKFSKFSRYSKTALLIFGSLLLWFVYKYASTVEKPTIRARQGIEDLDWNLPFERPDCWPLRNASDYSVVLDGRRYPKSTLLHRNSSIDFKCLNRRRGMKNILVWTSYFSDPEFVYELYTNRGFRRDNCPVSRCMLTNDKEKLNEADLVVVHMRDYIAPIPATRRPSTRFLFMLYESPMHSDQMAKFDGVFNFTSTYKQDSDFPGLYEAMANMAWQLNPAFNESFDFSQGRTGLAAILVSNCGASNRRLEYVRSLQRYMQVDVYGNCGRPCPDESLTECQKFIGHNYKFYFAFENSNCDDYITEKFFRMLKYDIVPVVYGGGKYEDYIPKSGFVNVFDFEAPRDLADYLLHLDQNSTAFNAFFKWKRHVVFDEKYGHFFGPLCDMCIHLLLEDFVGPTNRSISDIGTYWSAEKNCNRAEEFDQEMTDAS